MNREQKLKIYRLSESEFDKICEVLGREPEGLEWALFSALWSEHCSYKSSKVHLKKFYSQSKRVLQGFGENAGVIDLGQGEKVAFKMESHNHPSYIEPYQGAATGVGGILRDIFTMGARPIALANYLCFGRPDAPRMAHLVDGVVGGIGGYGNCVGGPTITGQTEFHSSYDGNILVNALAVGYFGEKDPVVTSGAKGAGNYVVYVGAKTGRDGVHGASMASESFDEDSESKKPTVQIGDPFFEKLLIESCLEVMKKDLVVSIQDMGAAGLTSSSFEMASKGGVGFNIDLSKVPVRDSAINPEEILLSESQERMLLICEPAKFEELKAEFEKWDLDAAVVGEVKTEKTVELHWKGEKLVEIDPDVLTENAPQYNRPYESWTSPRKVNQLEPISLTASLAEERILSALGSVEGCSREWVYQQYDQRVGASTAADASEGVASVILPESGRPLGLVLGCRPYIMRMDSSVGGTDALIYPALELSAKGFEPLAITDCLNFGNPEKPELMTEFVASVESLSAACKEFDTPVISGNVSLYNETMDKNVTSTPSTGVVGLRDSWKFMPHSSFHSAGSHVVSLKFGDFKLGGLGSEVFEGKVSQFSGELNVPMLAKAAVWLRQVVCEDKIYSSRLVGKFGLGYTLARMCLGGQGFEASAEMSPADWMAENLYQVILESSETADEIASKLPDDLKDFVEVSALGKSGGSNLKLSNDINISIEALKSKYHSGWSEHFAN
ncbi:MAG: phosphoribosylformylglycinamidine synthase subunit PurL [Bdellovibrionales bacterium]|nr:phosphoribosylformylglycinamidine synthase subunit PurL [Bdellovibrionales bacterium]